MATSLTLDDATHVMAMMQQLIHKAETGKDATEEQLALRMLGSTFESPENPITDIVTTGSGVNGVSVMAASGDKFDALVDEMMGLTKPADQQVADGKVPSPPVVTVLPNYDSTALQANYATLVDATSLCSLYTKMLQVKSKPNGFDITKEAPEAFAFIAKTTFDVMIGPLAGFYNFAYGSEQTYNNVIDRDQVHENLLGKIFAPFKFDDNTKTLLDGQLTNFVGAIRNVSSGSPANTMDFCLRLNLCPKINVTGDPNDKDGFVFQPCTYLVYMKINASSFSQSVGKNQNVDKISFAFKLTITKCDLNTRLFEANRPRFDQIFTQLIGENLRAFTQKATKAGEIKSKQDNPGGDTKVE